MIEYMDKSQDRLLIAMVIALLLFWVAIVVLGDAAIDAEDYKQELEERIVELEQENQELKEQMKYDPNKHRKHFPSYSEFLEDTIRDGGWWVFPITPSEPVFIKATKEQLDQFKKILEHYEKDSK